MNTLDVFERIFAWTGFAAVLVVLGAIFLGIWRGLRRPVGQSTGQALGVLRSPVFYVLASLVYFGLLAFLWRPLPLALSSSSRVAALLAGVLLFFPGLALVLWGRLALGRSYFVSTALGAQLYADHRLITTGPFAIVRHPMYLGLVMTGFGGVFLYRTWAFAFVAVTFLGLAFRARREEQALQAAFGEEWLAYRSRVPAFLPHLSWSPLKVWLRTLPPWMWIGLGLIVLVPLYLWKLHLLTGRILHRSLA